MIYWSNFNIPVLPVFEYKGRKYLDVVMSFDTENTTLFFVNGEWIVQDMKNLNPKYFELLSESQKIVVPYIWQLAIDTAVIYGRELEDFFRFWRRFNAVNPATAIVYVHNLGYDFEFIAEYLPSDTRVFAKAPYMPMKVDIPSLGLCFRCSYMLTNMSLEKCAKEFKLDVEKTRELEYSVLRTPKTVLSDMELHYCENDCLVIVSLIKNVFLKRYENIADIPLTQTGEPRREVKTLTKEIPRHMYTMDKIKPDLYIYDLLTRIIAGGYTHLNGLYNGDVVKNIESWDKRSSYPDIMCTRKFPSEKWSTCSEIGNTEKYAYIIHLKIEKVQCKYAWAYISSHKCKSKGARCDNGKIYSADWIDLWCTELDYLLIMRDYDYNKIEILEVFRSFKKYLPRELVLYILKLYGDKTSLKGLDEFQSLYLRSKQLVNAIFGLMLTNSVRPDIFFNAISHLWENPEKMTDEQIAFKLKKQKPFLNFSWGAWVTAYGRYDVFNTILDINLDAVYSDTDSIKLRHGEKHRHIFDTYNQRCKERIEKAASDLNIDVSLYSPKSPKGEPLTLGLFDYEGKYKEFKSLGSKKYCYIDEKNKFNFVVAGLKKFYQYDGEKIPTMVNMNQMDIKTIIPHGRTVHWHCTNMPSVKITDYQGNEYITHQKQGIVFLSACYTFTLTDDYSKFIIGVRNKYNNYYRSGWEYEDI